MKGLKIEDELETANSSKSEDKLETADSVRMFDSETPNQLKAKRKEGRHHWDKKGAGKGLTSRQADGKGRGVWNRMGQGARERREARRKLGETGEKNRKSGKNLKLSLRGNVEIQTQHWPDWLHKSRTGLV